MLSCRFHDIAFLATSTASSGWEPPEGALLWFQADAISGLTDGSAISTWPDSSGLNHHATGSGATRPLYQENVINGLPAVQFIGASGTYLDLPAFFTGTETAAELIMLVSATNDPGVNPYFGAWRFAGTSVGAGIVNLYPFSDGNIYDQFCSTQRPNMASPSALLKSFMVYNLRSTTNVYIANFNGVSFYSSVSNTFTTAASGTDMGTARRIGRSGASNYWFDGYICEILVFNRILGTSERQSVWDHLYEKWGLLLTETFEDYAEGPAVPEAMAGGIGFTEGADIAENFVKIVSEETFESYPVGTPVEGDLTGGTGWNGAPDVDTNA